MKTNEITQNPYPPKQPSLWLRGLKGCFASKKAVMCMLILAAVTALAATGKVDGTAFAAVVSVIGTIFCYTVAKTDQAAINSPTTQTPYQGTL